MSKRKVVSLRLKVFRGADKVLLKRFIEHHKKHPQVFELFLQYARQVKDAGKKKYSAWTIIQVIRWNFDLRGHDFFKINNDHIALYARMSEHFDKSLEGFFEKREMKPYGRKISSEERRRRLNNIAFADKKWK